MIDLNKCELINFKKYANEGDLVVIENNKEIPFSVKRLFYISSVPSGSIRGKHANTKSEFIMICTSGSVKVDVTDSKQKKTFLLDSSDYGLYIPKMIWKDMYDFSNNCVLLILSNEYYDNTEYIREFDVYRKLMENY